MLITKKKIQKFAAITIFPLVIFAAAVEASADEPVAPDVTQLTMSELRYELAFASAGSVGSCAVSANIFFFTAVAEAIPGLSCIAKAAVAGIADDQNEVVEGFKDNATWVGETTAVGGGMVAFPVELVADGLEYLDDRNVQDGERGEHQAGDAIKFGFSGTQQVSKVTVGKDSICRHYGDRVQSAIREMAIRYNTADYDRRILEKRRDAKIIPVVVEEKLVELPPLSAEQQAEEALRQAEQEVQEVKEQQAVQEPQEAQEPQKPLEQAEEIFPAQEQPEQVPQEQSEQAEEVFPQD